MGVRDPKPQASESPVYILAHVYNRLYFICDMTQQLQVHALCTNIKPTHLMGKGHMRATFHTLALQKIVVTQVQPQSADFAAVHVYYVL